MAVIRGVEFILASEARLRDAGRLTDVPGLRVGHAQDPKGITGCTVVLCEGGFTAAGDIRGGGPGTRETDLLHPDVLVQEASTDFEEGSVGAGMGATVGKFAGLDLATKSGVGTASVRVGDLVVGALAAVNAYGQVVDEDGSVLAEARSSGGGWLDVREVLQVSPPEARPIENTSLAVVGINARLTKAQVKRVAM